MPARDIYLKIEQVADYSPVNPDPTAPPPIQYRRDCMRTPGHEAGVIPDTEVSARKLTALVYREYLDPSYLIPKPDKLVLADVNEPAYHRRVPGTVIYTQPGERLRIHVLNGDTMPHSLHMHSLEYGIDSDGSWPFGTQSSDGRRSDEICPGERWTYTFDVTGHMIGAWPFHDHYRHIAESIDRGLFGGVVVRPPDDKDVPASLGLPPELEEALKELRAHPVTPGPRPPPRHHGEGGHGGGHEGGRRVPPPHPGLRGLPDTLEEWVYFPHVHPVPRPPAILHVPLFYHVMRGSGTPAFDSHDLTPGDVFQLTFGAEGELGYHCQHHAEMQGTVRVVAGGPNLATVAILDSPDRKFDPAIVPVRPGGTVRWEHRGSLIHTVTENSGGMPTYCFNGRAFVGNTPTILAEAGQRIRWYIFNLDLGMTWHNFHPHAQRWRFANDALDTRSLSPAESFIVETTAPPVLLHLPGKAKEERRKGATRYRIRGDFLVHCHVEMHMMQGMAGLVRSRDTLWLTPDEVDEIAATTGLPLDPGDNACPSVTLGRCETLDLGRWEEVPGNPEVTMMHAAPLPKTSKVLYWGYGRVDQSRLWEYGLAGGYSAPGNQPADLAPAPPDAVFANLHSAAHAFLNLDAPGEGTLLAHGGETSGEKQVFLFNPGTLQWSPIAPTPIVPTADSRFYATTLTLEDGRLLTLVGSQGGFVVSNSIEVYDPAGAGSWPIRKPLPTTDPDAVPWTYLFYPWTYLLPGGELFIAGPQGQTRRFDWKPTPIVGDPAKRWATHAGDRSTSSQHGSSVLLPLRPSTYEPRALIMGGNMPGVGRKTEMIDLSAPAPAWVELADMHYDRASCMAVLLPDGRVFVAGGNASIPMPTEILDAEDPAAGWAVGPSMTHPRDYHSSAILLGDGSVLMGGDPQDPMTGVTPHERYFPGYFFKPRPAIAAGGVPAATTFGATFTVQTPDASAIAEVVLLRPGAATHGFNMSQRFVGCEIVSRAASSIQVKAPPGGTVAPPGYYFLFIVNAGRVPSKGEWIRLSL